MYDYNIFNIFRQVLSNLLAHIEKTLKSRSMVIFPFKLNYIVIKFRVVIFPST